MKNSLITSRGVCDAINKCKRISIMIFAGFYVKMDIDSKREAH